MRPSRQITQDEPCKVGQVEEVRLAKKKNLSKQWNKGGTLPEDVEQNSDSAEKKHT
jgi:hypothetical protein